LANVSPSYSKNKSGTFLGTTVYTVTCMMLLFGTFWFCGFCLFTADWLLWCLYDLTLLVLMQRSYTELLMLVSLFLKYW